MLERRIAPALALLLLAAPAGAQQGDDWTWPERAENLQELPADFPGRRLAAVMSGFTSALGVGCSYCHVGEPGQPRSSYDFASDDNPRKVTARKMLQLLGVVNDQLAEIEPTGDQRVNMWCHTCHAGKPKPMTLAEALGAEYRAAGIDAAIAEYHELRERYYGRGAYDFSEDALNELGYQLLGVEAIDDAITLFRLNADYHPDSANVWDSLAEAYARAGDRQLARLYYERSLQLDPDNANARAKLQELSADQ